MRAVCLRPCLLIALSLLTACQGESPVKPPSNATAAGVPFLSWEVQARHPFDEEAFTQGLVWHAGKLWLSTGRYGQSSLRQIQMRTGDVLQRLDLPSTVFGEGAAFLGDRLYQLTWENGVCYVYEPEPLKLAGKMPYQGEGWGLTTNGEDLVMSDGAATLFFRDPTTFEVRRKVVVKGPNGPVNRLNELEWINGRVLANVWTENRVVVVDPASGRVTAQIDFHSLVEEAVGAEPGQRVLNGLAWDPARQVLLVTGKLWPWLYEVKVDGLAAPADQ